MHQNETIVRVLSRIADHVPVTGLAPTKKPASDSSCTSGAHESHEVHASAIVRYMKLPDQLEKGGFDEYGHKVGDKDRPSLVLYPLPGGPWQCWGVFDQSLEPGQYGFLVFTNVKGQAAPGGAFTEWDRDQSSPFFTDKLLRIFSVQRAPGRARIIGRNDSWQRVHAAAGLLFVPPPEPPKHDSSRRPL